jgi:hypothetical protein
VNGTGLVYSFSIKGDSSTIEIVNDNNSVLIKWAEVTGKMKLEEDKLNQKSYSADFGTFTWPFKFYRKNNKVDLPEIGSITYSKL